MQLEDFGAIVGEQLTFRLPRTKKTIFRLASRAKWSVSEERFPIIPGTYFGSKKKREMRK